MSLCDTCRDPGRCCRRFPLGNINIVDYPTKLHVFALLAEYPYNNPDKSKTYIGFPFIPIDTEDGRWVFSCVNLLPNGTCGDYDHRPYGPCVIYQPGQTQDICAEWMPVLGILGTYVANKLANKE